MKTIHEVYPVTAATPCGIEIECERARSSRPVRTASKGTARSAAQRMIRAALAALILAPPAAAQIWTSQNPPPMAGTGWPAIVPEIYSATAELMEDNNIVGMTIAVSIDGRLVYNAGLGSAGTGGLGIPRQMTPLMRSPIGSNTKALITGPSSVEAAQAAGLNPATTLLYGQGALLGTDFETDFRIGNERFGHIAGMAIDPSDVTHVWYRNGTMATGTSRDLTRNGGTMAYTLPAGKTPADIVDVAFTKGGTAVAFYRDRTWSRGTPTNLGATYYSGFNPDNVQRVGLPSGQAMSQLLAVAFAKSDGDLYAWFEDGTVTHGHLLDFDADGTDTFAMPDEGVLMIEPLRRYIMVGCGIARNDWVYCWYGDHKTSTGHSTDLDTRRPLADVAFHANAPKTGLHQQITLQHLLDHRSGFRGSGNPDAAAAMFGLDGLDGLTYAQIHRHFLRRQPLQSVPGVARKYANHNFGVLTLVIEEVTGESFSDYTTGTYLPAKGVAGLIVPRPVPPTPFDSDVYDKDGNGNPILDVLDPVGLGLAAGGFHATAESVLRLSNALTEEFTPQELDRMGFSGDPTVGLGHSGAGASYRSRIAFYFDGATIGGVDVGGVHVAVNSNTVFAGDDMVAFVREVAQIAGAADVPPGFDLWD